MSNNTLHCHIDVKENPYGDLKKEIWSKVSFKVDTPSGQKILTDFEWDIIPFAKWFVESFSNSRHDELLITDLKTGSYNQTRINESIAQAMHRLEQRDFEEQEDKFIDDWVEQLYTYRSKHNLRFAFPGARIKSIYIGMNKNAGEISYFNTEQSWSVLFDMSEFYRETLLKLKFIFDSTVDTQITSTLIREIYLRSNEIKND